MTDGPCQISFLGSGNIPDAGTRPATAFGQRGGPPRLKPRCEAAFHPRTELGGDHFDQRIQGLIRLSESFDLLNRVKNSGMVTTVIESADPGRAPSHNVLGPVHGNLPTETRGRLIPRDPSIS
jgi:hypothetical protein